MTNEEVHFFRQHEYSVDEVPPADRVMASAVDFMSRIRKEWKEGKTHKTSVGPVRTFHTKDGRDFWMARYSTHSDVTYEEFRQSIFENHTKNELEYIELLSDYRPVEAPESVAPWQHYVVHYKFPSLFSDREMAIWVGCFEPDPSKKQFLVVTLPSTTPTDHSFTRAIYCSLELVTYDDETNSVHWLMAQTSDSRGNIPRWIQDSSVSGMVVQDVPSFVNWVKKQRA
jgi:hypothetical protein